MSVDAEDGNTNHPQHFPVLFPTFQVIDCLYDPTKLRAPLWAGIFPSYVTYSIRSGLIEAETQRVRAGNVTINPPACALAFTFVAVTLYS